MGPSPTGNSNPDLEEQFLAAAETGNLLQLKECVYQKVNVKVRDCSGWTALHSSCQYGHLHIAIWLVKNRLVDVREKDLDGSTALHLASGSGQIACVQWLVQIAGADVDAKDNYGRTALHFASCNGHLEVVEWLILSGKADVEVQQNDGWTALHFASQYGHLDVVECLVQRGHADVAVEKKDGCAALHLASQEGHLDIVQFLVQQGHAIVEDRALHLACEFRHFEVVDYLVNESDALPSKNRMFNPYPLPQTTVIPSVMSVKAAKNAMNQRDSTVVHSAGDISPAKQVQFDSVISPMDQQQTRFSEHFQARSFCSAEFHVMDVPRIHDVHVLRKKRAPSVRVIDAKRAHHGGIILARLNMTHDTLADAVDRLDEQSIQLTADRIEKMIEYLPSTEERIALEAFMLEGKVDAAVKFDELCECEKFMISMLTVKHIKKKFLAIMFKLQFDTCFKDIQKRVICVERACEELICSKRLCQFLDMVIEYANRQKIGDSGERNAAVSTLSSFLLHTQTKSFCTTTLVFHEIIKTLLQNNEILLNFKEDLPFVFLSDELLWEQCVGDLEAMEQKLEKVRKLVLYQAHQELAYRFRRKSKRKDFDDSLSDADETLTLENEVERLTSTPMGRFTLRAIKQVSDLRGKIESTTSTFTNLLKFFGYEGKQMQTHELFSVIVSFCRDFDTAREQVLFNEKNVIDAEMSIEQVLRPSSTLTKINHHSTANDEDIISNRNELKRMINDPSAEPICWSLKYLVDCTDDFNSKVLGEGAFGKVYYGSDKVLGLQFAVKRVPLSVPDEDTLVGIIRSFKTEIAVLKWFRHPNIVALYGFNITAQEKSQFLVYEYLVNGSLSGFLMDDRGRTRLSSYARISIMFQVTRAVNFLHTGGCKNLKIFHRDIKSGNICLTQDYTAKLIDCGMSKFVPDDKNVAHAGSLTPTMLMSSGAAMFGTPAYTCPNYAQRLGRVSYTAACDVYSLGVVFAELIVGCLQDGQSTRNGQNFGDFYNRYIIDEYHEKVENGLEILLQDVDTTIEWNSHSVHSLCEITLQCLASSPLRRPSTTCLIQKLGEISKLDFRDAASIAGDASESIYKVRDASLAAPESKSCVLCHEPLMDSITCSKMHSTCIPCVEQLIQESIGRCGDGVCCAIVGCNSPFKDSALYGKISPFTYKEYIRERGLQRVVDQGFQSLKRNHNDVLTSLIEIKSVAQRTLKGMAYLATENVKKCPTLVAIVPAEPIVGRSLQDWVKWARCATYRRYHVYFVCQHSFTVADFEPRIEIKVPRHWMVQVAPVLRLSVFAIKAALSAIGPLPFPFPGAQYEEQISLYETFVNSFFDDEAATNLLDVFESACANGIDLPHSENSQLMTLTGPAYEVIADKATKLKRTHWKKYMVPVMNHHGSLIWVKNKYKGVY